MRSNNLLSLCESQSEITRYCIASVNDNKLLYIHSLEGEFELEGLPLRRDVLKHLGLPIEISNG